jgi:hypothetical protein
MGRPSGPVFILTLISGVWLTIVVFARVRQPVLTLLFTGFTYAVFALLINASLSPGDGSQLASPLVRLFVIAARLGYGVVWGSTTGGIAWVIKSTARTVGQAGFTKYES